MNNLTENDFFRELIYLYSAHKKYNMQRFSELGLTTGQPKVLTILNSQEGFIQKDLAERCMVEPATMTSLLNRMEQNGLIYKKTNHVAGGKRAMSIFLTEKGKATAEKVSEIVNESDDLALTDMTEEEKEMLLKCMHKCRANLENKLDTEERERKKNLWKQLTSTTLSILLALCLIGCSKKAPVTPDSDNVPTAAITSELTGTEDAMTPPVVETSDEETPTPTEAAKKALILSKGYKSYNDTNPIQTNRFGADPWAMEYDGTLYLYMTADSFETDWKGNILENSYGQIRTINVVSTTDMVNFTDCGEIRVAGRNGAASWANNSWAPAACWKMIDGKPKFFLYFADNGSGIGVLTADSPTGPFTDPLGTQLISRKTPNCADVYWLFDPAVLVDDDGCGYLYFGGGVPDGMAAAPGTGRVVKLNDDMISLACDPVPLDVPYLFEDSGIHKFNGRYYYSYCTNWNVDGEGTASYGFRSGEIACMVSDSPMGPFTYSQVVLKNPGNTFGLGGNNHHCIFNFLGEWYITYHARTLEKAMKVEHGYRSTHIECITINDDGSIAPIVMSSSGRPQLCPVNPFEVNSAVNVAIMAGADAQPLDEISTSCGSGTMYLANVDCGDYIEIQGVDFGDGGCSKLTLSLKNPGGYAGSVAVRLDNPFSANSAEITVPGSATDTFETLSGSVTPDISGVHNLFIICTGGEGYGIESWQFSK